jgi:hypothetical protein
MGHFSMHAHAHAQGQNQVQPVSLNAEHVDHVHSFISISEPVLTDITQQHVPPADTSPLATIINTLSMPTIYRSHSQLVVVGIPVSFQHPVLASPVPHPKHHLRILGWSTFTLTTDI